MRMSGAGIYEPKTIDLGRMKMGNVTVRFSWVPRLARSQHVSLALFGRYEQRIAQLRAASFLEYRNN